MGNLHSVEKAFNRLNQSVVIVNKPADLENCTALILPGVGAFDPAMENLAKTKLIPYINNWVIDGKPLLGICLGLQLLFESSEEGSSKGLGLFKGKVKKLPKQKNQRIPHMGWSKLNKKKECPLLKTEDEQNWMYFVHSYSADVLQEEELAATVSFGSFNIAAVVCKNNISACQFHPEKSGVAGERMLLSWLNWVESYAIR